MEIPFLSNESYEQFVQSKEFTQRVWHYLILFGKIEIAFTHFIARTLTSKKKKYAFLIDAYEGVNLSIKIDFLRHLINLNKRKRYELTLILKYASKDFLPLGDKLRIKLEDEKGVPEAIKISPLIISYEHSKFNKL